MNVRHHRRSACQRRETGEQRVPELVRVNEVRLSLAREAQYLSGRRDVEAVPHRQQLDGDPKLPKSGEQLTLEMQDHRDVGAPIGR